jgi:hypothetical protein
MSKFKMINEAQTLARVGKSSNLETLHDVREKLGVSLVEAASMFEDFSSKITPEDYDEWIRQVVLHGEQLNASGERVNLNRRAAFNEILGEILENDPKGKVNLGDDQLTKHVFDAVWKRYQGTRDHLKAQNVMKAREEEEMLHRSYDAGVERMAGMEDEEHFGRHKQCPNENDHCALGWSDDECPRLHATRLARELEPPYEDEELNVLVGPKPEETDRFEPSRSNYDADDMSGEEMPMDDELPHDDMGDEIGDDHSAMEVPEECPFDEGTPECDAWMAGYEAAMASQEEGDIDPDMDGDVDPETDDDFEGGERPVDLEAIDDVEGDDDIAATAGYRDEVDPRRAPEENEERVAVAKPVNWEDKGYRTARREYQHRKWTPPPSISQKEARKKWSRGYETFMGDTEGQRQLDRARRGNEENEEGSLLRSLISKPKDTLDQALKGVEDEGASAFDALGVPKNPHPQKSLAHKAWAKGLKNRVRDAFGFNEKPDAVKAKKRRR